MELGKVYRNPDLVIAPEADNNDPYTVLQPNLIIEILSESTENIDRGKKLTEYCSIASLQYYLIISQNERLVECYTRKGKDWIFTFYTKPNEKIDLSFYPAELALEEIYAGLKI